MIVLFAAAVLPRGRRTVASSRSDMAIERETPCLLGLYSVMALIGAKLNQAGRMVVQSTS